MIRAGYSPSVRLFEAAACGTPIISDYWEGLDSILTIGKEVLVARETADVMRFLHKDDPHLWRKLGENARRKVLSEHTAARRAEELESYVVGRKTASAFASRVQ